MSDLSGPDEGKAAQRRAHQPTAVFCPTTQGQLATALLLHSLPDATTGKSTPPSNAAQAPGASERGAVDGRLHALVRLPMDPNLNLVKYPALFAPQPSADVRFSLSLYRVHRQAYLQPSGSNLAGKDLRYAS